MFLTSVVLEVSDQLHVQATLFLGKERLASIELKGELDADPVVMLWRKEKFLHLPEIKL